MHGDVSIDYIVVYLAFFLFFEKVNFTFKTL